MKFVVLFSACADRIVVKNTYGFVFPVLQWEVSNRALEVLQNTKDAKGRTIEVCKIRLPPPLFRTYKEAEGLEVNPHAQLPHAPWLVHHIVCYPMINRDPMFQSLTCQLVT